MKVVLPLPAMPTQTIETGVFELAAGAEPSGAFAEDIVEVVRVFCRRSRGESEGSENEWKSGSGLSGENA